MAKTKLSTKIKNYVRDVKEIQKMRTLRSTRLGDIDRKYTTLAKKHDVITDFAINKWLDGSMTNKAFSAFICGSNEPDYGEGCIQYVEDVLAQEGGEDWLLENT